MQVIVHGGAGGAPDDPEPRQAVLEEAARTGTGESDPLSAVETAVRTLESDPQFNAGVGSAVQSDGVVRTDAGVMTGDREVGAACSMEGVEHAVSAARVVLEETPHVLVSGPQAAALAADHAVETGRDLRTDRTRERWAAAGAPDDDSPRGHLAWLRSKFGKGDGDGTGSLPRSGRGDPSDHDTVGAVAREGEAFAAATSTGGRWFALAGRVGDVPQVGSGFYCSPAGGASATGAGEDIARLTLARKAVDYLEAGHGAGTAARFAMNTFEERAAGSAGLIVAGEDGVGSAYNSETMQTATASD